MSVYFNNSYSDSIEGLYSSSPEGSPVKKGQRSNDSFSWDHDSSYDSPIKNKYGKKSSDSSISLDSPLKKVRLGDDDSSQDSPLKQKNEFTKPVIRKQLFLLAEDVEEFPFAMEEESNALAFMNTKIKRTFQDQKAQNRQIQNRQMQGQEILNIKFSQPSISGKTAEGIPLSEIINSMHTKGWDLSLSKGIQCVEMPNNELVSLDNRRLYCAKQVVEQKGNSTFTMPIVMCRTQNDCASVVNALFSQMEMNNKQFISKMLPKYMLIKQLLSETSSYERKILLEILSKIVECSVKINGRILFPCQIDNKLEMIGSNTLPDSPQWCAYTRMRVFNANIDDRQYGYEEPVVTSEKS